MSWLPYGLWGCCAMITTWVLQFYAYVGILQQSAQQHNPHNNKKKNNIHRNRSNNNDLVGGMYLDLWGLTWVMQYLSVVHTSKWFWLLICIPIYGLYNLYTTFYGGSSVKQSTSSTPTIQQTSDTDTDTERASTGNKQQQQQERQQKRAEQRKQKWG
jgi:hypothetical protein